MQQQKITNKTLRCTRAAVFDATARSHRCQKPSAPTRQLTNGLPMDRPPPSAVPQGVRWGRYSPIDWNSLQIRRKNNDNGTFPRPRHCGDSSRAKKGETGKTPRANQLITMAGLNAIAIATRPSVDGADIIVAVWAVSRCVVSPSLSLAHSSGAVALLAFSGSWACEILKISNPKKFQVKKSPSRPFSAISKNEAAEGMI